MFSECPSDSYIVGGAALPIVEAPDLFPYPSARGFQRDAIAWIEDGSEPAGVLAAPTGGGKTAIIATLADHHEKILCLYPTNALAEAQHETLTNEFGLDVDVLTGRTLTGTGDERSQQVLRFANDPAAGEIILTNPDVLQAILQHKYFSPGSELMRFFANFDAAVYDEFHYYDPLGASGLLMQMKVLTERGAYRTPDGSKTFPRILLPSATPSTSFVNHLEEDLNLNARWIKSGLVGLDVDDKGPSPDSALIYSKTDLGTNHLTKAGRVAMPSNFNDYETLESLVGSVPSGFDRFRYPMLVNRWEQNVKNAFEIILELLRVGAGLDVGDKPTGRSAVIFNSAAHSNQFHELLLQDDILREVSVKDNGYDTGSDREVPDDFAILNTTSKGEVGLDFDLDRLVMVTPFTATDFVQRIGRSARHSPSIVDVFGLNDPLWPPVQSYPAFLGRVVDTLGDKSFNRGRLRNLLGLRAARALHARIDDDGFHPEDIWEDFGKFPTQSKWRSFLTACDEAVEVAANSDDPFAPSLDTPTAKVVATIRATFDGLDSLRGQSLQHPIQYPFGDGTDNTEYDIVTALRHYKIDSIQNGHIVLCDGVPGRRIGHYPGKPAEGKGIDLSRSNFHVDQQLREDLGVQVERATWRETRLDTDIVNQFISTVDLNSALIPNEIETDTFRFHTTDTGAIGSIKEVQSS